jgi:Protein of unknown function (DUF3619)
MKPEKIAQLLSQGIAEIDAETLHKLSLARTVALQKQSQTIGALSLSLGHSIHFTLPPIAHKALIAILLSATLISAWGVWHHHNEHYINELDLAILSDELPMEVFVD